MNKSKRKKRNFWYDFENVRKILEPSIVDGILPSTNVLKQSGEGQQLVKSIIAHHGGMEAVAKRLGCKTRQSEILWTENELRDELLKFSIELGHFPKQKHFREHKRIDLEQAINHSNKNIHDWAIELGYEPSQKPKGYWKDFNNLRNEIERIIVNDKFPTLDMIENNIGFNAKRAIYHYHGNIAEVAAKMGYDPPNFFVTTDGHYVQSGNEYLVDEFLFARGIQHEVGGLIAPEKSQYRFDFKIGDYFVEIWGYEKNRNDGICGEYNKKRALKEEVYTKLGLNLINIESEDFQLPADQLEKRLEELFAHIQLDNQQKQFDIKNVIKHAYYWSEDRVLAELKVILIDLGKVPSWKELREAGRGDLADAVKRYGGFIKFKTLLGQKTRTEWDDDKIISELRPIIEMDKAFPIQSRLKYLGRYDLLRAINRAGGFVKWHIRMGFSPTRNLSKA